MISLLVCFAVNKDEIEYVSEGDERLKGYCIVHLKSGYILDGTWIKGKRKGQGDVMETAFDMKCNVKIIIIKTSRVK